MLRCGFQAQLSRSGLPSQTLTTSGPLNTARFATPRSRTEEQGTYRKGHAERWPLRRLYEICHQTPEKPRR